MTAAENGMSGPLGRERILELFEELSEELRGSAGRGHTSTWSGVRR